MFLQDCSEIYAIHNLGVDEADVIIKDGFGSDTDEIGSECHFLPHFNRDTNTNADLIGYEYKTDSSNPDTNLDTFSI